MARGIETAGAAEEHQEMLCTTVGTENPGEPATRVAAVEEAFDHLLDDGSEEAAFLLETALELREEAVEIVEEHSIEDCPLGMSRPIDSHGGRMASRNGPLAGIWPDSPERGGKPRSEAGIKA